jgi:hypothetical protein
MLSFLLWSRLAESYTEFPRNADIDADSDADADNEYMHEVEHLALLRVTPLCSCDRSLGVGACSCDTRQIW